MLVRFVDQYTCFLSTAILRACAQRIQVVRGWINIFSGPRICSIPLLAQLGCIDGSSRQRRLCAGADVSTSNAAFVLQNVFPRHCRPSWRVRHWRQGHWPLNGRFRVFWPCVDHLQRMSGFRPLVTTAASGPLRPLTGSSSAAAQLHQISHSCIARCRQAHRVSLRRQRAS